MKSHTVIAVANNKGGVGKTTTTYFLAAALAKRTNQRITVIDLDGQANLTDRVLDGQPSECGIAQVLGGKKMLGDCILWPIDPPFWFVPAGAGLNDIADDLVTVPLGVLRLRSAIERSPEAMIYLIDCPPNVGALTYSALIAADYVLIPSAPVPWSIMGVCRIREKIEEIAGALGRAPAILGTVATQCRNTVEHKTALAELGAPRMPPLLGIIPFRGGVDANQDLAEAYAPIVDQVITLLQIGGME